MYVGGVSVRLNCWGPCSDTATALFNLGNLYKKSKRLAEAEDCYRRAVGVLETAFGSESLEVARAMNNLGNLLKKQEKFSEAEDFYERTVGIRTKLLGASPDTANALYNLALLYELSNNLPAAEVCVCCFPN
jgi:tetratricopeptide (TPR) repeat protein